MNSLVPHRAEETCRWPLLVQALSAGDGSRVVGALVLLKRSEEGGTTARTGGRDGRRGGGGGGDGVGAIRLWSVHVENWQVVDCLSGGR